MHDTVVIELAAAMMELYFFYNILIENSFFFEILQFFITWYTFHTPCRWQYTVHYIYTFCNICTWISCGENVLFFLLFLFFFLRAIAWTEIVEKYTLKIYEVTKWCFISFFRICFSSCARLTLFCFPVCIVFQSFILQDACYIFPLHFIFMFHWQIGSPLTWERGCSKELLSVYCLTLISV